MVAPDRRKKEVGTIAAQEPRLNEAIRVKECRLIAYDGSQLGIYPIEQAQRIADNEGYDLVEIAPQAQPPVCRIMDYGKFKYDQAIKAKQARKNQSKIETKEMKFRPKIDIGDYTTKKKHVMRFLAAGSKVHEQRHQDGHNALGRQTFRPRRSCGWCCWRCRRPHLFFLGKQGRQFRQ